MANELTVSVSLSFLKGNLSSAITRQVTGAKFTVSGSDVTLKTQTIGTAEEAIILGDVATPGFMFVKNLDATNFVTIRPATGGDDCVKLLKGECALFRHAGTAPFAIADTAPVAIEYMLVAN